MSSDFYTNPNLLQAVIPKDENDNPVSVMYAYNPDVSGSKVFPISADPNGGLSVRVSSASPNFLLMHDNITSANTVIPTSPLGLFNFTGYTSIIVDPKLQGSGSMIELLPLVWNPVNNIYQIGPTKTFTTNQRAYLEVDGASDVYLLPVVVSGTVSIAVSGI